MAQENTKYLQMNHTTDVENLYTENLGTLLRGTKEKPKQIERHNIGINQKIQYS